MKDHLSSNLDTLLTTTEAHFILDDGRFVAVSTVLSDLLEFPGPEGLIGQTMVDLVHPQDCGSVAALLADPFLDPQPFRILKKTGDPCWVVMTFQRGSDQEPVLQAGSITALASLMEERGRLAHSLQQYRTILNEIEDAVAVADLKGNITFSNRAGHEIWGASLADTIGRNYRSYVDESTADTIYQAYNQVYRTGEPGKNITYEIIRKDGERRIVEDTVSLVRDETGSPAGFRTVSRDITRRREAEIRYAEQRVHLETIFGSVKDVIVSVNPGQIITEVNHEVETICGVKASDLMGKRYDGCFHDCSRSCVDVVRETLEKKGTVRDFRIECGRSGRPRQVVSVTSSPLLDRDGAFRGGVLVIRDITLLRDLERELRQRNRLQGIVGKSRSMQEVYDLIDDLSSMETTVLVTGESGTGKELVARALHYSGSRAFKPFVAVNCSALAESLLESELFGHVRGAFTGAVKDKQGRFEAAHGGTIFLDEIGDISPLIQLKLLRVLQEREFERVGESTPRKTDVRLIACTNKNLKERVASGEFREDLYYRLKVVEIALPPLRERLDDLPLLVDHFMHEFNGKFQKNIAGYSRDVLRAFMNYPWPGNVRELEHIIERAFVLCHGSSLTIDHIPSEITDIGNKAARRGVVEGRSSGVRDGDELLRVLEQARWNKTRAARLLGISRQTLYRKIRDYNLGDNL